MKTRTPHRHSPARFPFCANRICIQLLFLLVLGGSLATTRAELPPSRNAEMPAPAQEDAASGPPMPGSGLLSPQTIISAPFGTSFQVNVSGGQNMVGDAANEASMCIDPNNPNYIAIGWRQFN